MRRALEVEMANQLKMHEVKKEAAELTDDT